jgi:glycosyltransferase involved in cell wall biosynthesis
MSFRRSNLPNVPGSEKKNLYWNDRRASSLPFQTCLSSPQPSHYYFDMPNRRPPDPLLGLVIPCHNEEAVLPRLLAALEGLPRMCRSRINILFVDDGSADRSFELIFEASCHNPAIACIRLSRNFGHQIAVRAGLQHIEADAIGVIDADMQDPLEVLVEMFEKWREGYDVVYGIRQNRKEGILLRGSYALFYRLLKKVAQVDIPLDAGDFSIMDRRVVEVLRRMPEQAPFIRGLRGWVGFNQIGLPYSRGGRAAGESKYSVSRLVELAIQGLVSFSAVPLRLAAWMGLLCSGVGFILTIWALVSATILDHTPPGWASLAVIILFFGGIQLIVLGILGEYIGRIFEQVKNRPLFVIDRSIGWLGQRPDRVEEAVAKHRPGYDRENCKLPIHRTEPA